MSRASEIVILCEDKLQEVFVRRFLTRGWKKGKYDVRAVPYPQGGSGGAGEKHVRNKYPNELKACRTRHAGTILIVVMDADAGTVEEHHRELERACGCAQPPVGVRQANEAVVHVIPKWHIETWLAYLDNVSVSEDRQYKSGYGFKRREKECRPLVDRLTTACRSGERLGHMPDSLSRTCREFERIRRLL